MENIAVSKRPGAKGTLHAFTLIELLIVMVLVLLMYFVMFSPGSKPYQERQKIACQKNLQNVYVALKIYAADNNGFYPAVKEAASSEVPLSLLIPRSTAVTEIFICPGSGHSKLPEAEPFAARKISYAYVMGRTAQDGAEQLLVSDEQVDTLPKVRGQKVFSTDGRKPGNNHRKYGGNFLFCDGRVEVSSLELSRDLKYPENTVLLNPKP